MKYDIKKIHPDHQQAFTDVLAIRVIPDEKIDEIYKLYVELNKHPKKDWSKVVDRKP